jgi:hypothetical protein
VGSASLTVPSPCTRRRARLASCLGDGSSALGLYPWDGLAADAGVAAEGSWFSGVTLSYLVSSEERVDAVLAEAQAAGGEIARPAEAGQWGGRFCYFADVDGYLWKVGRCW